MIGNELIPQAVADAEANARLNGIENVRFYAGRAEAVIPKLYAEGLRADCAVVDPPRKGCDERLLRTLLDMVPKLKLAWRLKVVTSLAIKSSAL